MICVLHQLLSMFFVSKLTTTTCTIMHFHIDFYSVFKLSCFYCQCSTHMQEFFEKTLVLPSKNELKSLKTSTLKTIKFLSMFELLSDGPEATFWLAKSAKNPSNMTLALQRPSNQRSTPSRTPPRHSKLASKTVPSSPRHTKKASRMATRPCPDPYTSIMDSVNVIT